MGYISFLILFLPSLVFGATYQIGSDVTDDYASWTALQAATPETAGDTVSFRKGETFNETIITLNTGTAGNLITYTAHGSGSDPVIDGQSTRDYGIVATNCTDSK